MTALRPFSKRRPGKRPAAAIDILSSDDDEPEELVSVIRGCGRPSEDADAPELVFVEERPAGGLPPVPVERGTRVAIRGAGTSAVTGRYASHEEEDGGFGFRREGGGDYAIAWWGEEPGAWRAGWYIFAVASEEGVYCCTSGDEAHFPLAAWTVYSGPESQPGAAPPPSSEALEARAAPSRLLDVASGTAVLLHAAGSAEVNGTYLAEATGEGSLQFAKEGDGRFAIAWWDEQPGQWQAGWYVFRVEEEEGVYFCAHGDGARFPLGGAWEVYSGPDAAPGLAPPPRADARSAPAAAETYEFVYVRGGLRVTVLGAGTQAADGSYVAAFGDDGSVKFTRQGGGDYAIAWWDAEPGQWRAGWYIFTVEGEEGVYCSGQGDEARFPLGVWEVYSGPESRPGLAPAPRTTSEQAARDAATWKEELKAGWQGFCVGAEVELTGLKAAPELNGKRGRLLFFEPGSLRWRVRLQGDLGMKSIRPGNLVVPPEEAEEEQEEELEKKLHAKPQEVVRCTSSVDVEELDDEPEELQLDARPEGPAKRPRTA